MWTLVVLGFDMTAFSDQHITFLCQNKNSNQCFSPGRPSTQGCYKAAQTRLATSNDSFWPTLTDRYKKAGAWYTVQQEYCKICRSLLIQTLWFSDLSWLCWANLLHSDGVLSFLHVVFVNIVNMFLLVFVAMLLCLVLEKTPVVNSCEGRNVDDVSSSEVLNAFHLNTVQPVAYNLALKLQVALHNYWFPGRGTSSNISLKTNPWTARRDLFCPLSDTYLWCGH